MKKGLRVRNENGDYEQEATRRASLVAAESLLVTWANRGAHADDVEPAEAQELIDVCEGAIAAFKCNDCKEHPWLVPLPNGSASCRCDGMRWSYQ